MEFSKDQMALRDSLIKQGKEIAGNANRTRKGFKTQIKITDDFGNVLFEHLENQTVLGGALFTILKVFGVELGWDVETLNNIMGIANTGDALTEEDLHETYVCLFGAGIGGCGDTAGTVKTVKFQQREMDQMIPFRVTDSDLSDTDKEKYWFKTEVPGTLYDAYYLKSIQSKTVKALWRDGEDGEDGSAIPPNVYKTDRTEPIECFVDMLLRIDKKDFREYFNIYSSIDEAKINQIALFTGIKKELPDGSMDYKNVRMFSLLNFMNESLQLEKGINISYRVYIV